MDFRGQPQLLDFSELVNLEYVYDFELFRTYFQDLSGLENLTEIGSSLRLTSNDNLTNLDALSNAQYFGRDELNRSVFSLSNNPILSSIDGINQMRGVVRGNLQIVDNPQLSECSVNFICNNLLLDQASNRIDRNGEDCLTIDEVKINCGFNRLQVFFDANANGVQENDEPNISVGTIKVGEDLVLYPNADGRVTFLLSGNPDFIEYVPEEFWEVTTGNAITSTLDLASVPDLIVIGVSGTGNFADASATLSYNPIVCSRNYNLAGTVKNNGTQIVNAVLTLVVPGSFREAMPVPIEIANNTFRFDLGPIFPGQVVEARIGMTAPSVMDVTLGDLLELSYNLEITDQNNEVLIDSERFEEEFLCAYDPNDKQVFPTGVMEGNQTLFDETDEFSYLIRFQNTGNFPAQDVVVVDTLDPNLDLSTFEFIAASHEMTRIQRNDRVVEFTFRNIFLPDSINNEPESHGYISYKIHRKENLPEGTVIENTAYIFFDFNPAIVTNTVFNTMVSEIGISSTDDYVSGENLKVYPNPVSTFMNLANSEGQPYEEAWYIYSLTGQAIKSGQSSTIEIADIENGTYFIRSGRLVSKFIVLKE